MCIFRHADHTLHNSVWTFMSILFYQHTIDWSFLYWISAFVEFIDHTSSSSLSPIISTRLPQLESVSYNIYLSSNIYWLHRANLVGITYLAPSDGLQQRLVVVFPHWSSLFILPSTRSSLDFVPPLHPSLITTSLLLFGSLPRRIPNKWVKEKRDNGEVSMRNV